MNLKVIAGPADEARPVITGGNDRRLVERALSPLVGHLQEQQERELLRVIHVGQPVLQEDRAVIPKLLNECGSVRHRRKSTRQSGRESMLKDYVVLRS